LLRAARCQKDFPQLIQSCQEQSLQIATYFFSSLLSPSLRPHSSNLLPFATHLLAPGGQEVAPTWPNNELSLRTVRLKAQTGFARPPCGPATVSAKCTSGAGGKSLSKSERKCSSGPNGCRMIAEWLPQPSGNKQVPISINTSSSL